MSDNEDATAPLWNSEVLSVEDSPGEAVAPAFGQEVEEGSEGSPGISGQDSGDVLPEDPTRTEPYNERNELDGEPTSLSSQASAKSRDAKVLAGGTRAYKVNGAVIVGSDGGEVAVARDRRVAVGEDGTREPLYLGEEARRPAEALPGHRRGLDAGAHGGVNHRSPSP
jgi:hypothetical protein